MRPLLNTALSLLPSQRLREKAELKIATPLDVVVELTALDRFGNVERRRTFRAHSFVSNFIALMAYAFAPRASQNSILATGKDITGTIDPFATSGGYAARADPPFGMIGTGANIVVGTGTTTPAFGDSALGGLAARAQATLAAPILAATSKFVMTGTISFTTATTINEVGVELPMIFWSPTLVAGSGATFLIIHDNVSGGFAVSAGGSIIVSYTVSVTT